MKAIIPAAGLGTRFLPATKAQPKEMLPVVDKPVIQYIVEEALDAGVDEVVVVSNKSKTSIEQQFAKDCKFVDYLRAHGKGIYADAVEAAGNLSVSFVYQDKALGLGHAVYTAANETASEPFFVMLGDVLVPDNKICPKMLEISKKYGGASVIAVVPVADEQIERFGVVGGTDLGDNVYKIDKMVEKPVFDDAPSNLAIFGRYLLTPKVMELLSSTLPGAGGEIQLTDALVELLAHEDVYAYVIDPKEGFDTGTVETWLETNIKLAMRDSKLAGYLRSSLSTLFV